MARNDGIDRTSVRNLAVSDKAVGNTQQHNEREKDSYRNPDIIPQRVAWNVHFKKPTASYTDLFAQLEAARTISTRGLKPDATHYCELVGAKPLHLASARPFGHLKAPLGLSLLRKRELD